MNSLDEFHFQFVGLLWVCWSVDCVVALQRHQLIQSKCATHTLSQEKSQARHTNRAKKAKCATHIEPRNTDLPLLPTHFYYYYNSKLHVRLSCTCWFNSTAPHTLSQEILISHTSEMVHSSPHCGVLVIA